VSKSLVSLVLNGSPSVREEKRRAVLKAMHDLGYRPNASARSLTSGRTRTVGVLLNDLRNPWFADTLEGLNGELHGQDMTMLLGDARLDRRADERLLKTFMDMRVDGLILVGSMPVSPSVVEAASRLPTVVAGARDVDLPRVDVSVQDDVRGARLAAEYLLGLGHRRIAHVTGTFESVMRLRAQGYEAVMREAGLADAVHVVATDMTDDGGYRATLEALAARPRPTALFVGADVAALGSLRAAAQLGLQVPQDLSVLGFDNTRVAGLPGAALSTIDVESREIGRNAVHLLLARIADPQAPRRTVQTTPTLVVRATTAAPPGG
jgi:DNA-binding LacI/PurR family transcriptional regulator